MAANPANVAEIKSYWNSHPGGTQEQLNDYFATHTQFTPDDYIGAFPEISKNPVDWINAINSGVNDYNVRNNVTVAGPGNGNITQADYDAQQRRIGFQNFLAQNLNDPQAVMQYMTQNGISSAEAQNMTDGALGLMAQSKYGDMNTYLRMNGAQDGFQGLKVYTPEQIKNFIDWQKAQNATPAGFNTGGDYQQKQVPVYDTPQAIRNATDAMERAYRVAQVRHDNFGEPIEQEWDNPNWAAITQKKKDDYAALIASRSGGNWAGVGTPQTVAGPVTPGGVQPNPNTGTGGNNASAVPANANAANVAKIRADWANPTGKQEDLDAYFADHMGEFTAADYAAAFPQYGGVDQYMTAIAEGIARWKQTPAGGGYDLNPDALMNAALHGDSTIGMNYKQVNDLLNPKTGFVDPANIRQATNMFATLYQNMINAGVSRADALAELQAQFGTAMAAAGITPDSFKNTQTSADAIKYGNMTPAPLSNASNVAMLKRYWYEHPGASQEDLDAFFAQHPQFSASDYASALPQYGGIEDYTKAISEGANRYQTSRQNTLGTNNTYNKANNTTNYVLSDATNMTNTNAADTTQTPTDIVQANQAFVPVGSTTPDTNATAQAAASPLATASAAAVNPAASSGTSSGTSAATNNQPITPMATGGVVVDPYANLAPPTYLTPNGTQDATGSSATATSPGAAQGQGQQAPAQTPASPLAAAKPGWMVGGASNLSNPLGKAQSSPPATAQTAAPAPDQPKPAGSMSGMLGLAEGGMVDPTQSLQDAPYFTNTNSDGGSVRAFKKGGKVSKKKSRGQDLDDFYAHMADGGEVEAGKAITNAAMRAGVKPPVVANKPLTNVNDFRQSLGDKVRERAKNMADTVNAMKHKYDKGDRIFTQHGVKNNLPPYEVLHKTHLKGAPAYHVHMDHGDGDWSRGDIPESAIIDKVSLKKGGAVKLASNVDSMRQELKAKRYK